MANQNDFHVAIVGGGLCGLVCAAYLSRAGIKIDLFESAPQFSEIGAGVHLGPNALRALDEMGLTEAIMAHADQRCPSPTPFRFVSGLPGHEHILDYESLPEDATLGIHRPAFMDALIELIDPTLTHFDKRCTSVSRDGSKQVVHFTDGTTCKADVVLGADGIKSAVRQAVSGDPEGKRRVAFTGTIAYRALLFWEDVKRAGTTLRLAERPHCIAGVDKHIITFPIRDGKIINVVMFYTDRSVPESSIELPTEQWVAPATKEEILDAYKDCGTEVQRLLSLIQNPGKKWLIHVIDPPLSSFVRENVALVGDAAHAMCPHLGAGVGQGFEDALMLCKLLAHPEAALRNIGDILRVYDKVRRPRAYMVLERSAMAGEHYESLCQSDNSAQLRSLRVKLSDQWDFVHHYDLGADFKRAIELLRDDGAFRGSPLPVASVGFANRRFRKTGD